MKLIEKFREELFKEFESNKGAIYLGEDVRNAHRGIAIGLHEKYGDNQIIDMPISESAFTGLALGLAISRKKVFVEYNFAGLVYLGLDQIFNQAHKYNEMLNTNLNLDLIYILPTGTRGGLAGHHSDNPYALLSHLGIQSFMPTNALDCEMIFNYLNENRKPTAIFLPVASFFNEINHDQVGADFNFGFYRIHKGNKLNIICTGTTYGIINEVVKELTNLDPNIFILTDLSFSEKTINAINNIHDFPTIFIDDSFEICGIASEINKYIPEKNLVKPLCRVSKNVPFAEHLEADVIVSKKRVKEVLTNLSK